MLKKEILLTAFLLYFKKHKFYLNNQFKTKFIDFSKDDTGTTEAIKTMLSNNKDKDFNERLKLVASTFLTNRQIGTNLQLI